MQGEVELHTTLTGHSKIDFDKRKVRKALRQQGAVIRKKARKLVARRAISGAGDNPGRDTGALMRSIKVKVFGGGFGVIVAPYKTDEMGDDFYPAFLYYGTPTVKKRANYMIEALDSTRESAKRAIREALKDSLIPRK